MPFCVFEGLLNGLSIAPQIWKPTAVFQETRTDEFYSAMIVAADGADRPSTAPQSSRDFRNAHRVDAISFSRRAPLTIREIWYSGTPRTPHSSPGFRRPADDCRDRLSQLTLTFVGLSHDQCEMGGRIDSVSLPSRG
jgi:hypothetical protein